MTRPLSIWRKRVPRKPVAGSTASVEPVYLVLAELVREMRERLGITQAELAQRLGVTRASVSNLESGRQRVMLHDLPKFAWALEIPVNDLVGELLPALQEVGS